MQLSARIKPISYFKDHAAKVIAHITESKEPFIITQNGEATCVIQDIESFDEMCNTIALLKILAMGRQQIELGKVRQACDVFAEMEQEIAK